MAARGPVAKIRETPGAMAALAEHGSTRTCSQDPQTAGSSPGSKDSGAYCLLQQLHQEITPQWRPLNHVQLWEREDEVGPDCN